eukprot:gene6659-8234_t
MMPAPGYGAMGMAPAGMMGPYGAPAGYQQQQGFVPKKWRIFKLAKPSGRFFSHDTLYGMWCLAGIIHNEWLDYTLR